VAGRSLDGPLLVGHLDGRHVSMVLVDVAKFGNPMRTNRDQLVVRAGMYGALEKAFAGSGIPWRECHVEDRGDGVMVLVPANVSKNQLASSLPGQLASALAEHNAHVDSLAKIQMRMALHSGEVHHDANGATSDALNFAFRLLDAPLAKDALARSTAVLVVIVSDRFYRDVVRHDPAATPESFQRIRFERKETADVAWICLRDADEALTPPGQSVPALTSAPEDPLTNALITAGPGGSRRQTNGLNDFVTVLMAVPTVGQEDGRRILLQHLRPEIAGAVPYSPRSRHHVFNLVRTCMDYQGGLDELLSVIHFLEGESLPVRRLDQTVADLLAAYGVES